MRVHSTFQIHHTNFQASLSFLGKFSSLLVFPEQPQNHDLLNQLCPPKRHILDREHQSQPDRCSCNSAMGQDFTP